MALGKIRRFVFVLAAVAVFLATVLPGIGVSARMADSPDTAVSAAMDGMNCPDRATLQDGMAGCTQATCIGSAVMTDFDDFDVLAMRADYVIAVVTWPDDFIPAPSTPPI